MVVKRMSAKEARNRFSDLLGAVYYARETVVVEKRGCPVAVVINPEDYERLLSEREARLAVFDDIRAKNSDVSAQEAEEDAAREIAALRSERATRSARG